MRKRIKSVLVPYFLWSVLFYAFVWILYASDHSCPQAWRIAGHNSLLRHALLATGLNPEQLPMLYSLWYLRALFAFVVLSPVFLALARISPYVLIFATGPLYLLLNPGDGSPIGLHVGLPFEGLFYFSLGLCCADRLPLEKKLKCWQVALILISGLILIFTRALLLRYGHTITVLKPLTIVLLLVGVWSVISANDWSRRIVSLSFLIYVTHIFGLQLFSFFFGSGSDNAWLLMARGFAGIVFAIMISHLLHNVFGRYLSILWEGAEIMQGYGVLS